MAEMCRWWQGLLAIDSTSMLSCMADSSQRMYSQTAQLSMCLACTASTSATINQGKTGSRC
jgi:hypothetical protein